MKLIILKFLPIIDVLVSPIILIVSPLLKYIRSAGLQNMPVCHSLFKVFGVIPVRDHYYEPLINPSKHLNYNLDTPRKFPGINFDYNSQLKLLSSFNYKSECSSFPTHKTDDLTYYQSNGTFEMYDAVLWYSFIRHFKPSRIIEIGCGNSSLMTMNAIKSNVNDDENFRCSHYCIEPFEVPWLDSLDVNVIRCKVEDVDISEFTKLNSGDILFIDSSHVIRPQGDVLFEYLEILPSLKKGVIVHIHDIFTPTDYPDSWIKQEIRLWNEQYLLEAFLTGNSDWEILCASNYIYKNHRNLYSEKIGDYASFMPSSFYIRKIN